MLYYNKGGVTMGVIILGMLAFFVILAIALVAFVCVVNWKLYEKANKPGWAALVPIYNVIVLLEIIGYKWYYIFVFCAGCIPVIGALVVLLFNISYNIKLAKSFGQSVGFGICMCFFAPICMAIIAFDKNMHYVGPQVNGDIDFNNLF
jgi:hypothetical protein